MTATILDGRALAKTLREELRQQIRSFREQTASAPALTVVRVHGDPASERYLRTIQKACEDLGMTFREQLLHANATQAMLEHAVRSVSRDEAVDAVLLHLPLPAGFDARAAIAQLDPMKDVDGVHPQNAGLLAQEQPRFVPNTPAGGMELLRRNGIELYGKRVTVIGRSTVVGKPMALLLMQEDATVTTCHRATADLAAATRNAEILVCAAGAPELVTASMVTPGVIVVDFGINVLADGSIVGDADFAGVAEVASAITPVPGGTGPVTNVMLLRNVLWAAQLRRGNEA